MLLKLISCVEVNCDSKRKVVIEAGSSGFDLNTTRYISIQSARRKMSNSLSDSHTHKLPSIEKILVLALQLKEKKSNKPGNISCFIGNDSIGKTHPELRSVGWQLLYANHILQLS